MQMIFSNQKGIIEGSLEVKLPTYRKMQPGQPEESADREREREKQRERERERERDRESEERWSEKRRVSQKKEDPSASKGRLAEAAGAERSAVERERALVKSKPF